MEFKRYNIAQLARVTNTDRNILVKWRNKGWLQPTQLVSAYPKYSIDAFLKAEQIANEEYMEEHNAMIRRCIRKSKTKNNDGYPCVGEKITPEMWDRILKN